MTKADRQVVFDKYGGRCAYCGCGLTKGWHVDELKPVRRLYEDHYEKVDGKHKWSTRLIGYTHPDRLHIDNQMPACASCNINKHSGSLEEFRALISGFMKHLNEVSTQYKIAKRYGLVTENVKPIVFYFETFNQHIND
jgi:5-methylcytosine-specific restriction endonuclease McrA